MTLAESVGQLVVPGLNGVFTPTDSDAALKLERLVREGRVGGFHVFGGGEALPPALLNPVYGTTGARAIKGNPLAIAALVNRLQRAAAVPLLFTADFEGGAGYIVDGATRLPRAMALGATRDPGLAERAGRVGAAEGRAMGVHVDYYPVVDVNVNPKNPVIGIRSFGEDPELVARMAIAVHARHPAGRHAGDREALPRPRRHGDGHPPRPRHRRAPARAPRRGRARPVPRADRRGRRRRHVLPHPAARARPDRRPAGDAQPPGAHRTAPPGAGVLRPGVHGLDVDARGQPALQPRARGRARDPGRGGRRARLPRPGGGAARDPAGRRARRDRARAARPLGRAHPRGEGAARAPPLAHRGRGGRAGRGRRARAPGGRGGDRRPGGHAAEGRAGPGAAARAARGAGAAASRSSTTRAGGARALPGAC